MGVGRLHQITPGSGQIRYMAVDPTQRGSGVGTAILQELESLATRSGFQELMLNAREDAIAFYQANGYEVVRASHHLFGSIPHFEMRKRLVQNSLEPNTSQNNLA